MKFVARSAAIAARSSTLGGREFAIVENVAAAVYDEPAVHVHRLKEILYTSTSTDHGRRHVAAGAIHSNDLKWLLLDRR